jgi:ferredoxin
MLKYLLESGQCIKIICGVGNDDVEAIHKIVSTYIKRGIQLFDVNASPWAVRAAKDAINDSGLPGYVMVSYGIKGDPHTRKAHIDKNLCDSCSLCSDYCSQYAIESVVPLIYQDKCIGCGECAELCHTKAIKLVSTPGDIRETLPSLVKLGIDAIELHISGASKYEAITKWEYLCDNFKGTLSLCVDRSLYGDIELTDLLRFLMKNREPYSTIIQADGVPMSGANSNASASLQAVAIAQIINRAEIPQYLFMSGGTNEETAPLANLFNIKYDGISFGSCARQAIEFGEHEIHKFLYTTQEAMRNKL